MKKFDTDYKLLGDMYQDEYFPDFLVDKVKELIQDIANRPLGDAYVRLTSTAAQRGI